MAFTDGEGDQVVHHEFLTDAEAAKLIDSLVALGARDVAVTDLTPPQALDAGVTSSHDSGRDRPALPVAKSR